MRTYIHRHVTHTEIFWEKIRPLLQLLSAFGNQSIFNSTLIHDTTYTAQPLNINIVID